MRQVNPSIHRLTSYNPWQIFFTKLMEQKRAVLIGNYLEVMLSKSTNFTFHVSRRRIIFWHLDALREKFGRTERICSFV